MSQRFLVLPLAALLLLAACGGGGATTKPSGGAATPAGTTAAPSSAASSAASPAASAEASAAASSGAQGTPAASSEASPAASTEASPAESAAATPAAFECTNEPPAETDDTISGDLKLVGWSAGQVEEGILRCTLDAFEAKYPNVTVTFEQIADDYQGQMTNRLGQGDAPDLFYVNGSYAQDWIDQGLLQNLDDMASTASFDTSHFYPNLLANFQRDGASYAYPKDSSVLAMQTNDKMLSDAGITTPPTTLDELVTAAQALKDNGVETPMCLAAEWPRAGAFIESFGGGIVDETGASTLEEQGTKDGIQWYLSQYQNGLADTFGNLGDGWCGEAFGREHVAIAFEGNWIGPFMSETYPDVAYTVSPIPQQAEQATLAFTAGYGMSPNAANPDASWALLSYLTGQEGMQSWVDGGLVLPSRDDVTVNDPMLQQYAEFVSFAHPGEGLTPQWSRVADAFNGALSGEIGADYNAQNVIDATKPVLDEVLAGE